MPTRSRRNAPRTDTVRTAICHHLSDAALARLRELARAQGISASYLIERLIMGAPDLTESTTNH